jgi:hypothetical protein
MNNMIITTNIIYIIIDIYVHILLIFIIISMSILEYRKLHSKQIIK